MGQVISRKHVAIEPLVFTKIDAKVEGGFARIAQKVEVCQSTLIMNFIDSTGHWLAGSFAVLAGDSGLQAWNKQVYEYNGKKFVLCPIDSVIAFGGASK